MKARWRLHRRCQMTIPRLKLAKRTRSWMPEVRLSGLHPGSRSFCTRSSISTSAPRTASSICRVSCSPGAKSRTSGTNSGGPHSVIFAPAWSADGRPSGHAAVEDIADDRDVQSCRTFCDAGSCRRRAGLATDVRACRLSMTTANVEVLRIRCGAPAERVANHDHVSADRAQSVAGSSSDSPSQRSNRSTAQRVMPPSTGGISKEERCG